MVVCLSGFMGSGKSTLGRALADAQPGWRFADLDDLVEEKAGKSIPDIFREEGEKRFRALEQECLEEILSAAEDRLVLSLGGGTLTRSRCARLVRRKACCIYLKASENTLVENLRAVGTDGRPLLSDASGEDALRLRIRTLLEGRSATYEGCADYILSTDGRTGDDLLQELLSLPPFSGTDTVR